MLQKLDNNALADLCCVVLAVPHCQKKAKEQSQLFVRTKKGGKRRKKSGERNILSKFITGKTAEEARATRGIICFAMQ
jgi:hypothetical protein